MPLSTTKPETGWLLAALAILILASFFLGLGSAPLFDVDEGAFSEATREMMISKNYLTTYLNGTPRFDKPILIYWLQLSSVRLFGLSEFAFRLPSALAGTAWATSVFLFVRKESGNRQAFLAAAMMVLSLQIMVIAKAAIADGVLNCFLAITMLGLLQHYKTGSKPLLYLAFAAAGFGMLTKGPIAIIIPFAVTFLFSLQERMLKTWFRMVCNPAGIILFLGIALPWYLLEYRDQGMAFVEGFFFKHNINRFNSSFEGHSGSTLYYIPVIMLGLMPFTGLFFTLLFNIKALLSDRVNRFLLIWFGFVFLFFSLSGTKLPHYMIYGYTPLFILMARALPMSRHPKSFAVWPLLLLAGLACLPLFLPTVMQQINDGYIKAVVTGAVELIGLTHIIIIIAAMMGVSAIQFLPRFPADWKLIATGVIFSLLVNLHLMPLAGALLQEPVKEAALMAKKKGYKIVMWKIYNPSFLVYSESFVEKRTPEPGEIVLTSVKQLDKLESPAILYSKYGIVMVKLRQ
ncbi:MAG: glycosyltransferase family 39 protein [Chlorobiaceae bacterium]|nr:glycosyltransferase family 39 protein [Chlorobiaceae bacterium]